MKSTYVDNNDIEIEPYDLPGLPSFSLSKGIDLKWDMDLGGSSACVNLLFKVIDQKIAMIPAFADNEEGDVENVYVDIELKNIEVLNDDNRTPLMHSDISPRRIEMEISEVKKEGGALDSYLLVTEWVKVYF